MLDGGEQSPLADAIARPFVPCTTLWYTVGVPSM
jgi:hypothetical protein